MISADEVAQKLHEGFAVGFGESPPIPLAKRLRCLLRGKPDGVELVISIPDHYIGDPRTVGTVMRKAADVVEWLLLKEVR